MKEEGGARPALVLLPPSNCTGSDDGSQQAADWASSFILHPSSLGGARGTMIEVVNLCRRFDGPDGGVLAVDNVSFSVAPGEVFGLLGPNGAGKTTTLRIILGLLRPTSGVALINGYRSTLSPDQVKRCVGLVSTTAGLYQHLSEAG